MEGVEFLPVANYARCAPPGALEGGLAHALLVVREGEGSSVKTVLEIICHRVKAEEKERHTCMA